MSSIGGVLGSGLGSRLGADLGRRLGGKLGLGGKMGGVLGGLTTNPITQGLTGTASVATGFLGSMLSPMAKFFNDIVKLRVAAAHEATKKREARDEKIEQICELNWKEELEEKKETPLREVSVKNTGAAASNVPVAREQQNTQSPDTAKGDTLKIENSTPTPK